ncbi:MAG: hypothetical protein RIF36_17740 [Imperialibacter sp.]|uniref:hypothetical protein n=1 Tax=Imperialibacter sp. TaxID=2038411 RepID=UPI0032EFFD6F
MKNFQTSLCIGLFALLGGTALGQSKDESNSLYAEFLGNGIVYSLGYERVFLRTEKDWFAVRVGLGVVPESRGNAKGLFLSLPLEIVTRGIHKNIEIGTGITPYLSNTYVPLSVTEQLFEKETSLEFKVYARLGYVSSPGKRGLFWRAAFVPDLYDSRHNNKKNNVIGFGLGLGKKF